MTKREMYAQIREMVIDNAEMVEFIDHEVKLLDKKRTSAKKPTKTQLENDAFKADILTALGETDKYVTIKELCGICDSIAGLTNQRITHLLTDLRKEGKVSRTYIKKVAYFALSDEEVEGE